jgi:hypothetical protein
MSFLVILICGPTIGLGLGFMTCLHWPIVGIILVLSGVALLLIRLICIDIKERREKRDA